MKNQVNTETTSSHEELHIKGGFFLESAFHFFHLQISKRKNIPKSYPELEI